MEEQVNKLSVEEVDKIFSNYKAKLSGQMVKSLDKSIIRMYSMGACAVLGMTNQDALSQDLESDPFLNYVHQRFTCELYHTFGSFLSPLSIGLITNRDHLANMLLKMETTDLTSEKQTTPSKYKGLGAAITAELMIGFWCGIGVILAIRMVNSLDYCIEEIISRK